MYLERRKKEKLKEDRKKIGRTIDAIIFELGLCPFISGLYQERDRSEHESIPKLFHTALLISLTYVREYLPIYRPIVID